MAIIDSKRLLNLSSFLILSAANDLIKRYLCVCYRRKVNDYHAVINKLRLLSLNQTMNHKKLAANSNRQRVSVNSEDPTNDSPQNEVGNNISVCGKYAGCLGSLSESRSRAWLSITSNSL